MSTLERAPQGRQIKGPSAVGSDPRRFWQLTWSLAATDFKLRFFGSVLGYMWQLLRPLAFFTVLLIVFTQVINLGEGVSFYAQALLLGIVFFQFLSDSTGQGVRCIVERENLVRKIEFPRLAVPLAQVLQASFNFGLNLMVVVAFLLAAGADVRWSWVQLPVIVVALAVVCAALTMLLSMMFVRYRDVQPIWEVVLTAGFYASPIFYPVQVITGDHAELIVKLLMFNPFAALLQQARHALIDPSHPSASEAIGGVEWLLVPAGLVAVVCFVAQRYFRRHAPKVAELL